MCVRFLIVKAGWLGFVPDLQEEQCAEAYDDGAVSWSSQGGGVHQ